MKTSDTQLQTMFVRATDDVIPPAPWLEAKVVDAVQRRNRTGRGRERGGGGQLWVRPGLRPVAAIVAVLIAAGAVAALLTSARLLHSVVPGAGQTTQTPSPFQPPFTPSPAVRGANWPPGGTVPTQLAGAWQGPYNSALLHMGAYTWEIGDETAPDASQTLCGPICYVGNVVVNGSEIDFIDDICTVKRKFGFERFTYTLTGDTLVLNPASGPGQSVCVWRIGGTYTRVSTPAPATVPFAPSPAVRDPRWPPGGPVSAQLAGSWRQAPSAPILYLGAYTFQLGEETPDPTTYPGNINPALYGNVVVNGSEIDFIAETCRYAYAPYTVERYTFTVAGNTLVIARGPGQTQCGWPTLEGTYTRMSTS